MLECRKCMVTEVSTYGCGLKRLKGTQSIAINVTEPLILVQIRVRRLKAVIQWSSLNTILSADTL